MREPTYRCEICGRTEVTVLDLVTLGIASAGLLLAMINTYWAMRRDRVRLKVEPIWLMDHGNHIDRADNPAGVFVATSTRPDAPERLPGGHIDLAKRRLHAVCRSGHRGPVWRAGHGWSH